MTGIVFDTSAILAAVFGEVGAEAAQAALAAASPALISAVNAAEAIGQLARRRRWHATATLDHLQAIGLRILPFDTQVAAEAGRLEPLLVRRGVSLGDRACLATGHLHAMPVLTADRAWATLGLQVEVRLIR
jgi:PIN domain nuclease of toxin-antitoxin system